MYISIVIIVHVYQYSSSNTCIWQFVLQKCTVLGMSHLFLGFLASIITTMIIQPTN